MGKELRRVLVLLASRGKQRAGAEFPFESQAANFENVLSRTLFYRLYFSVYMQDGYSYAYTKSDANLDYSTIGKTLSNRAKTS